MKALEKKIRHAIDEGLLEEPFNAVMMKEACPGWDDRIYHLFLSEHSVGNGCNPELFERVSFGLYHLIKTDSSEQVPAASVSVDTRDVSERGA